MNDVELTSLADYVLCTAYKVFQERIESGGSHRSAINFDLLDFSGACKGIVPEDVDFALQELARKGLVKRWINGSFQITDAGIIYKQKRFPKGLKQILAAISSLAAILQIVIR